MTFRTSLLAVCMIAVPGVALFSHRVPADVRAGVRGAVTKGVAWCHDAVTSAKPAPTVGPAPAPVATAPTGPATPAPVGATSPRPLAAPQQPEAKLASLGATSLECRPLPGPQGGHVASCAVPLDAEGQLLRVFHGSGGDRDAALQALAAEVDGWRSRSRSVPGRWNPVSPADHP